MSSDFDEKSDNLDIGGYNSKYLRELYQNDPDKFSELQDEILQSHINSIDNEFRRFRMQALQARVNTELSKMKDPHAKFIKMQELFYIGLNEFKDVLHTHQLKAISTDNELYHEEERLSVESTVEDNIIEFKNETKNETNPPS